MPQRRRPLSPMNPMSPPSPRHTSMSTSPQPQRPSDDDSLAESFLVVHSEDDGTASTVGSSSIHSSVLGDVFSDSGSEPPPGIEHWEDSADEAGSDILDAGDSTIMDVDGVLVPSPSLVGGEYTDAEATISEMTDSRSTMNKDLESMRLSQIRLIMPDPATSFPTSSNGTTPSGSVAQLPGNTLRPMHKHTGDSKAIDKSWLEASSRLWNVAPDADHDFSDVDGDDDVDRILRRPDQKAPTVARKAHKSGHLGKRGRSSKGSCVSCADSSAQKQAKTAPLSQGGGQGKWFSRAPFVAFAAVVSLALLRSFGPPLSSTYSFPSIVARITSSSVPDATASGTIWDRLISSSGVGLHQTTQPSPQVTARLPDLSVIKNALSTLSIPLKPGADEVLVMPPDNKNCKAAPDHVEDDSSSPRKRKAVEQKSCCEVSVVNSNLGLTVPTTMSLSIRNKTWARTLQRKLANAVHEPAVASAPTANATQQACACHPAEPLSSQVMVKVQQALLSPLQAVAFSTVQFLASVYQPAWLELRREYEELAALCRSVIDVSSTLTQFVLRRAARGASVSRQSLEHASKHLKSRLPPLPKAPAVDKEAIAKARAGIDHLSDYVEDQAAVLADYIEEQSVIMHEKSIDSLKQAKRGLDKLIAEARKVVGDDQDDGSVHRKISKPIMIDRGSRSRKLGRGERRKRSSKAGARVAPPIEKPTWGRRVFDLVHHGAIALVR